MNDFTYAIRFLRKRWGFASVAVLVMALGISLTTSMYAIIEGVLIRGPRYQDVDRLVTLRTTTPAGSWNRPPTIHDYTDWRSGRRTLTAFAAYQFTSATLSGDGNRAERYGAARISASTFEVLGVQPSLGRGFTPDDDLRSDADVVLLSHDVWVRRYDADPDIVGRVLRLDSRPTTVIGVMPPDFRFPSDQRMWLPLSVDPGASLREEAPRVSVVARMADGVELDDVIREMAEVGRRLEAAHPVANEGVRPVVESFMDSIRPPPEVAGILYTAFVAVVGVLLIACANVANLLFALTMARGKELAVRTAMGADRGRVIRQLLMESLVLAVTGSLVGLGLTYLSLAGFTRAVASIGPPSWVTFEVSPAVFVFALGTAGVAAVAAGMLPALFATRTDVAGVLRDESRGGSSRSVNRWSAWLVGLEIAVSCALLIGAGLMVRTTLALGDADYGVRSDGILAGSVSLPSENYPDADALLEAAERLRGGLAAIPGVETAALSSALPGLWTSTSRYAVRERTYADDRDYATGGFTVVTPEFFEAFELDIVEGRALADTDRAGTEPVVVVDERFVERNWPDGGALGRQVRLGTVDGPDPWMTVVGVVETPIMMQANSWGGNPPEGMFIPATQRPMSGFNVVLRSSRDPASLATPTRDVIARLDPDVAIEDIATLEQKHADSTQENTILGWMFGVFGAVALILASVGLYAVMSFSVSRRRTEVGVRMAMGAEPGGIVRLILLQGSRPLAAGLAVGVLLALGLGRALGSQLYGVEATDAATFTAIVALLTLVSLAALLLPATRASRIPPVVALRDE